MEAGPRHLPVLADYGLRGEYGLDFQLVYLVFGPLPLCQTAAQVPEISNVGKSQRDDRRSLAAVHVVDHTYIRLEVVHTRGLKT